MWNGVKSFKFRREFITKGKTLVSKNTSISESAVHEIKFF